MEIPLTNLKRLSPTADATWIAPVYEEEKRALFRRALWIFAGLLGLILFTAELEDPIFLGLGIAILVLALMPGLLWTRRMPYHYPFFEIFMATAAAAYGFPLLYEHETVNAYPEEVRIRAALAVILFLVVCWSAFRLTRGEVRTSRFWTQPILVEIDRRWLVYGLVLTALYSVIVPYVYSPPPAVAGVLRAAFLGIGMSCSFILCMAWGHNLLSAPEKALIVLSLSLQFAVFGSSLVLRSGASLVLLGMIGYFFGSKRIPFIAGGLFIALLAVLNVGKYEMRDRYWLEDYRITPALRDLPKFYADWVLAGTNPSETGKMGAGELLLERNSLLQMICLVVHRTPEYRDYLWGETYRQIPGQFVPRLFWPEKPRGHISTYTLSIYYGLQEEDATYTTTIAFGLLSEAYANFGLLGLASLGALAGYAFKKVVAWTLHSPIFSYGGLIVILITAWSFQTELTLSIWITSLFQGAISLLGCAMLLNCLNPPPPGA